MKKIYTVIATFEGFDWKSIKMIGVFENRKDADFIKEKWDLFYQEKKKIFDMPEGWVLSEKDIEYGNESWHESIEYSRRCSKYSEIWDLQEVSIEEFELNSDKVFVDSTKDTVKSMMLEWDRDYKIGKILK